LGAPLIYNRAFDAAVNAEGLQLHVLRASRQDDFDAIFEAMAKLQVGALAIAPDNLFTAHSGQLAELTVRHALPAAYEFRRFVAAGGLMGYGSSETE
jgi:putative ABC transport system substrate-binding protein